MVFHAETAAFDQNSFGVMEQLVQDGGGVSSVMLIRDGHCGKNAKNENEEYMCSHLRDATLGLNASAAAGCRWNWRADKPPVVDSSTGRLLGDAATQR